MNKGSGTSAQEPDLAAPYDAAYYASHCGPFPYERSHPHWSSFFGGIADELVRSFRPRRVFDAGCAHGFLVEAFWDRGVEAWGRDISDYAISRIRPDIRPFCSVGSIADPIEGAFDLVTCIEVLEHMPEADAMQAIASMTAATGRILFSSSPTDFTEPTHITVRPPLYWLRRFAEMGFAPRNDYAATFVTPYAVVLEKRDEPIRETDLLTSAELARARMSADERTRAAATMQAELVCLRSQMDDAERQSAERERMIGELQTEIAEARTRTEVAERQLEAALSDLRAPQAVATERLDLTERRRLAAETALTEAKAELNARTAETVHLRNEVASLTLEHSSLLVSTSWRVTRPMREIASRTPPRLRRRIRQVLKLAWWCATLQVAAHLRERRQRRRGHLPDPGWDPSQNIQGGAMADPAPAAESGLPSVSSPDARPQSTPLQGGLRAFYEPPFGLLPWFDPLSIEITPERTDAPMLNMLLPGLAMKHMSGGPNTAINLASQLAAKGVSVRLVSTNASPDPDASHLRRHIAALSGTDHAGALVEVADASDRRRPLPIGANDVFMATAWWTAQMAKYAVRRTNHQRFFYLIQDYEPIFHPEGTQRALAEETYRLDHIPVVNTSLLHEFLVTRKIGRFAEHTFAMQALVFEPAVDTGRYAPPAGSHGGREPGAPRKLLFYARPTNALRNAFELGVAALQKLIAEGSIDPTRWKFIAMGESIAPVPLGRGAKLAPAPWLDLDGYAALLKESDVLLSLMLSPHPSYPPLEMAACGRPVVTTTYANKTAERLAALSPNIIGVEATIEGIADGLLQAIRLSSRNVRPHNIALPASWPESFAEVLPRLHASILGLIGAPRLPDSARIRNRDAAATLFPGYRTWPSNRYNLFRYQLLADRREDSAPEAGLFSLVTTVWNTNAEFLSDLAESVFGQDFDAPFEWIILDNGTTEPGTRAVLDRLATHPLVTLERIEDNVGIIGGLHRCLRRASNHYIVPLDSDDLLTPDCLRIIAAALRKAGYPMLAYTDEDKVLDDRFRDPYCKPGWDPVLFVHSCYIAHLCAIDREQALFLDAYTDPGVEGSHDWDTFLRFYLAGHTPLHVPEIVYTWRMHPKSTSGNIASKDYIYSSQRRVIETFIQRLPNRDWYSVALSPLFKGAPDWRIVRSSTAPLPIRTVVIGGDGPVADPANEQAVRPHERLPAPLDLQRLGAIADDCRAKGEFVHLISKDVLIEDPTWAGEAMTLFEAFRDTAIVGGRIHADGRIVAADGFFGFGRGCDSPNLGRLLDDSGYFAQMWKPHSASSVPLDHCVVDASFLAETLPAIRDAGVGSSMLAAWLGAAAHERKRRVVYSPFFSAARKREPDPVSPIEELAFVIAYGELFPDERLLSPRLGLTRETAYRPELRADRAREELGVRKRPQPSEYPTQHAAELMARRARSRMPREVPSFSLLTTIYARTPVEPFRNTADSVLAQTVPATEWIILENGPIPAAIEHLLDQLQDETPLRRLRVTNNLGRVGGLRYCLERATGDFVVPLDGDDILTPDALQQLALALEGNDRPSFVYSDEDVLSAAGLGDPYRRPPFDPVLNAADSYVWHVCAFRLDRALALGVYSDPGPEFCHDWDTVSRFAAAGEPIGQVPHVLYHWRVHAQSSSNSGSLNQGSLDSVRHVMSATISRQSRPDLYEIRPFPISRGVEQLAILRRHAEPMLLTLVYQVSFDRDSTLPEELRSLGELNIAKTHVIPLIETLRVPGTSVHRLQLLEVTGEIVLFLRQDHAPASDEAFWEAMRLFEMHPDVGAVGGRVTDPDGRVIACCTPIGLPEGRVPTWIGKHRSDPGPYAMALKPQTVATVPEQFFFCRASVLKVAIEAGDHEKFLTSPAARIMAVCQTHGLRLAYSPLIEAHLAPNTY